MILIFSFGKKLPTSKYERAKKVTTDVASILKYFLSFRKESERFLDTTC